MIGTWEIILIVLMVLILFGANKIPEFMKALNSGIKEFKKATTNLGEDANKNKDASK
jgi:sec-independent protein translocase protein TatA|tara:strand:+ start:346 stop:516 length:171 start_codon:yes stop_codon:yes gene_type:complete